MLNKRHLVFDIAVIVDDKRVNIAEGDVTRISIYLVQVSCAKL